MTIALTGSTIEPVISHSTSERQDDEQADGEREAGGDRVLLVDELRGGAADERRVGRGRSRISADERRAASPCGVARPRATSTCQVEASSARGSLTARTPAQRLEPRGVALDGGRLGRGGGERDR